MLVYGDPIVRAFDVAGHEFTHAVTRNESGLEYAGEAGAINEALSDILGVAVEKYANNGKFNWTMGEQSGRIFRDMKTHHLSLLDIRRTIDIIITYLLMLTTIMVVYTRTLALLIK